MRQGGQIRTTGLALALLAGCASAPRFERRADAERQPSRQEALHVCADYRLPNPADRPIALKPFLECVRMTGARHPLPSSRSFEVFLDELDRGYGGLAEPAWSPALGVELETAIRAALRVLARSPASPGELLPEERRLVERHFPRFTQAVASTLVIAPDRLRFDEELEGFLATLAALSEREGNDAACGRLRALQSEASYLRALHRDALEIGEAPLGISTMERYRGRLRQARSDAEALRPSFHEAIGGARPGCGPGSAPRG